MAHNNTKNYLHEVISEALGKGDEDFRVVVPPDRGLGDYATNAAFLRATSGRPSDDEAGILAGDIIRIDKNKENRLKMATPAVGFINLTLNESYLVKELDIILKAKDKYGRADVGKGKTAIVEYFQLNTAKQPHVGHIRSAVIGDCLKRLLASQGYKVLSDTHVGDWGTQFGILIAAYKKYGDRRAIEKDPLAELENLYVRYNEEMEKEPELRETGKREFAALEAGDKENRKLWEWFNEVSMKKLHEMAGLLGLEKFDLNLGESFYEDKMAAVTDDLKQKQLLRPSQGAQIVDLTIHELGVAVIIKSDGATTYLLRDLAKLRYFWKEYGYERNIYVVDTRQALHFQQLFKIAEMAGWPGVDSSAHVDYGFMRLPEGMLSTRKGTTIALEEVIREAGNRAKKIIEEKNPELGEKDKVAGQVGLAALKYFDLSHNPKSDITFRWEDALSFEGNTGPYLQYARARIKSILRRAGASGWTGRNSINTGDRAMNRDERAVLAELQHFPEVVQLALEQYQPNALCDYLYAMAQTVNYFYEVNPVLKAESEEAKQFRLNLISAAAQVLKNGLELLGIQAPEEM